jgi:hypothetical protein
MRRAPTASLNVARLSRAGPRPCTRRGSVLVIVMITLLFATFALVAFMEKAAVDLLVEQRDALTRRLRAEAYSALEVTLGVLVDFREAGNGLRSPSEGWNDPLAFASYTPADGRVVEITFEDESGKLPLPRATAPVLANLFLQWGVLKADAEALADVLLGWMKRDHVYTSPLQPNYEYGAIPYEPPGRPLRSYHELAAIEKARDFFYDPDGRPNDFWRRFVDNVSLFDFAKPNLNGTRPDVLAALGQYDPTQTRQVTDYLRGTGSYQTSGPGYFQTVGDVGRITGPDRRRGRVCHHHQRPAHQRDSAGGAQRVPRLDRGRPAGRRRHRADHRHEEGNHDRQRPDRHPPPRPAHRHRGAHAPGQGRGVHPGRGRRRAQVSPSPCSKSARTKRPPRAGAAPTS